MNANNLLIYMVFFLAKKAVRCIVPQGSILGPLLFTLYVNDMSTTVYWDLYADDSMLQITGKDVSK